MLRSISRIGPLAAVLLATGCGALPDVLSRSPAPAIDPGTTVRTGGKYVLIDLDANVLSFRDGERVLWSGPVGTGTGFRLKGEAQDWEFSTPEGIFHVQFKEEKPVWILPDWYFIENKLPIPPEDSPKRKLPGGLGEAAIYLGNEIAIHGTDKPELLGQRVSHGCIRLSNENAVRLFHNVQIGTPIVIRGGPKRVAREQPDSVAAFTRPSTAAKKPVRNPLLSLKTPELLRRLDAQLVDGSDGWPKLASELIRRGLDDDAIALRGVLARAGRSESDALNEEFATFLADAFSRGSLRTVVSLARIPAADRDRAARAIVRATMELYHGPADSPVAPWPTRRLPKGRLGPEGQKGWGAVMDAERVYREENRTVVASTPRP